LIHASAYVLAVTMVASPLAAQADARLSFHIGDEVLHIAPGEVRAEARAGAAGRTSVFLALDPARAGAMAKLTERHIGDEARLNLCGKELLHATIMSPIGGQIVLDLADAVGAGAVLVILSGEAGCEKLEAPK